MIEAAEFGYEHKVYSIAGSKPTKTGLKAIPQNCGPKKDSGMRIRDGDKGWVGTEIVQSAEFRSISNTSHRAKSQTQPGRAKMYIQTIREKKFCSIYSIDRFSAWALYNK